MLLLFTKGYGLKTAVYWAANFSSQVLLKFLVGEGGAHATVADNDGKLPLGMASQEDGKDCGVAMAVLMSCVER